MFSCTPVLTVSLILRKQETEREPITNKHSHLAKSFLFLVLEQYSSVLCPRQVRYDKL